MKHRPLNKVLAYVEELYKRGRIVITTCKTSSWMHVYDGDGEVDVGSIMHTGPLRGTLSL